MNGGGDVGVCGIHSHVELKLECGMKEKKRGMKSVTSVRLTRSERWYLLLECGDEMNESVCIEIVLGKPP